MMLRANKQHTVDCSIMYKSNRYEGNMRITYDSSTWKESIRNLGRKCQCFNSVGWVKGRTAACKSHALLVPKAGFIQKFDCGFP